MTNLHRRLTKLDKLEAFQQRASIWNRTRPSRAFLAKIRRSRTQGTPPRGIATALNHAEFRTRQGPATGVGGSRCETDFGPW
jgi:hypothetical protein